MSNKGTNKKVTNVGGDTQEVKSFQVTAENKDRAKNFRLFAIIAWLGAFAGEGGGIYFLLNVKSVSVYWLIAFIAVAMILAMVGSALWKKANRIDPASEKDKVRFFLQNQLGVIITALAFIPFIILIFTNQDLDKKQKGILGGVAIFAVVVAGIFGADFNPPSIEQYTEQIQEVQGLTGKNFVYWTKSGTKYHIYPDCHHINSNRTDEIFEGGVERARELKNITELCKTCRDRAAKEANEKALKSTQDE